MWRTSVAGLSVLLLQLIAAGHAAAHAILTSPVAWKGMADGTGIKYRGQAIPGSPEIPDSISCEGFTDPGTISMTSIPGSALTVAWDVTIDHANPPGVSVKLQMGGDGTANGGAWIDLATGVDVHSLSTTVTLPSMVTGNGVLRWSWQSQSDGGYYVSCSTISLKAVAAETSVTESSSAASATTKAPTSKMATTLPTATLPTGTLSSPAMSTGTVASVAITSSSMSYAVRTVSVRGLIAGMATPVLFLLGLHWM